MSRIHSALSAASTTDGKLLHNSSETAVANGSARPKGDGSCHQLREGKDPSHNTHRRPLGGNIGKATSAMRLIPDHRGKGFATEALRRVSAGFREISR